MIEMARSAEIFLGNLTETRYFATRLRPNVAVKKTSEDYTSTQVLSMLHGTS